MSDDEPTKIDKQPDRHYEERRYVESVRADTIREVFRDSWLPDAQALRLNCVNMACGVVEKPLFTKDDEGPRVEESVLRIAARFEEWIIDGDANTVAP